MARVDGRRARREAVNACGPPPGGTSARAVESRLFSGEFALAAAGTIEAVTSQRKDGVRKRAQQARERAAAAHEKAAATHLRAAALHEQAAQFQELHAAAELKLGHNLKAEGMKALARNERERARLERLRAERSQPRQPDGQQHRPEEGDDHPQAEPDPVASDSSLSMPPHTD